MIILINGQMIFLQRVILFNPLSEIDKIEIIKRDRRERISEKIISPKICGSIPKKKSIAIIKAITTLIAILNKQLQIVLFISILLISYLYILLKENEKCEKKTFTFK